MKDLLEFLTKSLVDSPDEVQINQIDAENSMVLELRVAPADIGKVIGKQGRIAQALRTLMKAASVKAGKRVMVEIIG